MKNGLWTKDYRLFAFLLLVLSPWSLVHSPAFAQSPSLNLPPPPTQPLTVIFKDVTKHDQFSLIMQTLKQGKRVDSLVMKRAQRGYIEYEGKFFGETDTLVAELEQAVEGKLKIESKSKNGSLEITITSQ